MKLFSIIFMLCGITIASAQVTLHSYVEIGRHQASVQSEVKNAYIAHYQWKGFNASPGLQFRLYNTHNQIISGATIQLSKDISLNNQQITTSAYYLHSPYSDLLAMHDYGIKASTHSFQFISLTLGINKKSYRIKKQAMETYNIDDKNRTLNENFSVIYNLTLYLKPQQNTWNIGMSLSNIDHFYINQSTNPLFNIKGQYTFSDKLKTFLEAWYKQAGVMNIQANYFGYLIRGGIQWDM